MSDLGTLTRDAIQEGTRERENKEAEVRKEVEAKNAEAAEQLAAQIIEQIPGIAREAAKKGKAPYAIVMWMAREHDYFVPREAGTDFSLCKPEWLQGAAKIVYEACLAAGLNPTLIDGIEESFDKGDYFIAIPITANETAAPATAP